MSEDSIEERIRHVLAEMLGHNPNDLPLFQDTDDDRARFPTLEISRNNLHDSKAAFNLEYRTVRLAIQRLEGVFSDITGWPNWHGLTEERIEQARSLKAAMDAVESSNIGVRVEMSATDLIHKNAKESGYFFNSLYEIVDMKKAYETRLNELETQRERYWSQPNRAPNHYAREISLRIAKLYQDQLKRSPTNGSATDGGHPSTAFSRAVESVFEILNINADHRRACEWAVQQLRSHEVGFSEGTSQFMNEYSLIERLRTVLAETASKG